MPVDVTQEFVALDGIVATGAYGSAVAPTNSTSVLGGTWVDLGEATDAGVTRTVQVSTTVRRGWQNKRKLRTLTSEAAIRFVFTLVQTNLDTIKLYNGKALTAGSVVVDPGVERPLIAFDFDMIDTATGKRIREYVPSARVVEVGDRVALSGGGVGFPVTVESEYDSGIAGHSVQFWSEFETTAVATLTSALPTAVAVGGWVEIIGAGLGATISLTVGGVSAPVFNVVDNTRLHFKMPAGSAGSAPIIVTNPGGASSALAYTRGA